MLELLLEIITVNHPPYRCTALISLRIPFDTTNPFFFLGVEVNGLEGHAVSGEILSR